MNPRRRRLGFILAAVAVLVALVLPFSSEVTTTLPARPNLLAFSLAAAILASGLIGLVDLTERVVARQMGTWS